MYYEFDFEPCSAVIPTPTPGRAEVLHASTGRGCCPVNPSPVNTQACFDANTGKYSSCITLKRALENSEGNWTAVGLLMTKTHIIVTGSDGVIEWFTLPAQPGGGLEVQRVPRDSRRSYLRFRIRGMLEVSWRFDCVLELECFWEVHIVSTASWQSSTVRQERVDRVPTVLYR